MIFFILFYYKTRCIKWKYSYENASYDVFCSHKSLTVIVVMMQISLFKLTKPGS